MKATLDGTMKADSRLGADISFDIVKLFGLDTDLKLTFGSVYNDRISALRAYNNSYALGGNVDRIRTVNSGIGFYIDLGYGDLVTGRLGVVPKINEDGAVAGSQHFSATASVLVKPIDGVKVSAGYVYYPDNSAERYISLDHDSTSDADHAWAAAVDWDIAGTFDLDFDIGLSASYVGAYREDLDDEVGTIIAATVYGGYDFISAGVEFGVVINPVQSYAADQDTKLNFTVVKKGGHLWSAERKGRLQCDFGTKQRAINHEYKGTVDVSEICHLARIHVACASMTTDSGDQTRSTTKRSCGSAMRKSSAAGRSPLPLAALRQW